VAAWIVIETAQCEPWSWQCNMHRLNDDKKIHWAPFQKEGQIIDVM
jgi:hypothetical protein